MAGRVGACNAYFYTLVSRDTREMYYSTKRQQFLVDQGYAFKVNDAAKSLASAEGLPYANRQAQLQLLAEVLACGEVEELEEEEVVQLGARNGVAAPAACCSYAAPSARRTATERTKRRFGTKFCVGGTKSGCCVKAGPGSPRLLIFSFSCASSGKSQPPKPCCMSRSISTAELRPSVRCWVI